MNIVFDLDGTIADCTHRLHWISGTDGRPKSWNIFFANCGDDKPIVTIIAVLRAMIAAGHDVRLFTGRPERCRRQTEAWLDEHVGLMAATLPILMRKDGDHRPDHIMKMEFLEHFQPDLIFDDRRSVVDAWRARGIKVCHVAEGEF